MRASLDSTLLILANILAVKAQSCPDIHIFGARETSVSPGFGSAGQLVDMIKADHPGATSEAIDYPACGGQASCGGVQYGDSAKQGTQAVTTAVNGLNQRCPQTKIVLVGYSQGGQIMDNNICGGPDSGAGISDSSVPLSASAVEQVKAVIMLGDPRFVSGLSYGVGTCTAGGFDARPAGFTCPNADKVQIYCDSQDPFCCNGNDSNHHQQYGQVQPIPDSQLFPVETQDSVDIDILNLHSNHHPLTERALGLIGRGPRAPSRHPEGDHKVISCEHLDTLGFTPSESYIKDTIENLDDECLKPSSRFKRPVYMVTGLKIARGAKYSSRISNRVVVGRDFALPRNPLVSLGVSFVHRSESVVESSWTNSDGFIVAFKVVQVWINHEGEVKFKEYNKNAVMEFETASEDETAPTFPSDGGTLAI
ncbi:acetylxylan esterase precursor [Fusarium phyllophilum]|uniref:Acetylxylan esterase n=1 Tax=Fusarium phyllophilum TaxID=47803 RepID=A0A8H5K0I2_9HYPO|nr:acetylxylan esterase precursor [Fusarium phyllophilum]